jgi:hypothetical protein
VLLCYCCRCCIAPSSSSIFSFGPCLISLLSSPSTIARRTDPFLASPGPMGGARRRRRDGSQKRQRRATSCLCRLLRARCEKRERDMQDIQAAAPLRQAPFVETTEDGINCRGRRRRRRQRRPPTSVQLANPRADEPAVQRRCLFLTCLGKSADLERLASFAGRICPGPSPHFEERAERRARTPSIGALQRRCGTANAGARPNADQPSDQLSLRRAAPAQSGSSRRRVVGVGPVLRLDGAVQGRSVASGLECSA